MHAAQAGQGAKVHSTISHTYFAEMAEEASTKAKQVFISYGREPEVSTFVCRLKSDLESNGFTVWLDLQVNIN